MYPVHISEFLKESSHSCLQTGIIEALGKREADPRGANIYTHGGLGEGLEKREARGANIYTHGGLQEGLEKREADPRGANIYTHGGLQEGLEK